MREICLYVTSRCNLACKECIMWRFMRAHPKYDMSLEELTQFLEISAGSGYKFDFWLTGGEPLIWKNLKTGLQIVRESSVCNSLNIFSNVIDISQLDDEVMGMLDVLRISKYEGNEDNMECVQRKYSNVRVVDRKEFWVNPKEAVPDTLPAVCLNYHQHLYMGGKVYACPHSGSIAEHNKSTAEICIPLQPNFIENIDEIFHNQQSEICTWCISNQKVRDKVSKIRNARKTVQTVKRRDFI